MAGMLLRNGSTLFPAGMMVSVEMLSPTLMITSAASSSGSSLEIREGDDVRAGDDLHLRRFLGGRGKMMLESSSYILLRVLHGRPGHQVPQLARIGDHPEDAGGRGGLRRAEVDLVVLGAAPAGEVAREGAQARPGWSPAPAPCRCSRGSRAGGPGRRPAAAS